MKKPRKTKAEKAIISQKIWAARRKNAAEKKKYSAKHSKPMPETVSATSLPDMPSSDVAPVPYEKTVQWTVTDQTFSKPQIKELGLFAVTDDGDNFRLLRINGDYIKKERHSG